MFEPRLLQLDWVSFCYRLFWRLVLERASLCTIGPDGDVSCSAVQASDFQRDVSSSGRVGVGSSESDLELRCSRRQSGEDAWWRREATTQGHSVHPRMQGVELMTFLISCLFAELLVTLSEERRSTVPHEMLECVDGCGEGRGPAKSSSFIACGHGGSEDYSRVWQSSQVRGKGRGLCPSDGAGIYEGRRGRGEVWVSSELRPHWLDYLDGIQN
ncbi:hypothetical protein Bbelb_146550 [Branchiostoma belcheri]|nr:hypothetical protein Bbelb_146550 [Branchiostoma belcheri]